MIPWLCQISTLMALLALPACVPSPETTLLLTPTRYDAFPGWERDDHGAALAAFRRSCAALLELHDGSSVGAGKLRAPVAAWQQPCREAMRTSDARAREFFEHHFTPFAAAGPEGESGLFTGYYEPLLLGSRKKQGRYRIPVYRAPPDLSLAAPYLSRTEIEAGALAGRGLEIAWIESAVPLFFAQVQGSARLRFPDGQNIRLAFAGRNNHPYVAIGKVLRERGALKEINLFTIRRWLDAHPEQAAEVMQANPSYVFFKEGPVSGNPHGAQDVELTPERSLAVDPRFIPYGMPVYVMSTLPQTPLAAAQQFHRLMVAQDTGSAIRGPVRGDIFFGAGDRAEALAGMMKAQGTYILLVPHGLAARLQGA